MAILIKGIKMPKNCHECPFLYVTAVCDGSKSCPILDIKPHGRLIDADALLQHQWVSSDWDCGGVHEIVVSIKDIDELPTIIEAEEGE